MSEFEIINGTLVRYNGDELDVIIPSEVIQINKNAFENNPNLTSISVPKSVNFIGDNAFKNCINLKKIIIYSNNLNIGKSIFKNCNNIEIVYYGKDKNKLFLCEKIKSIFAPNLLLNSISSFYKQKYINGFIKEFKNINNINDEVLSQYVRHITKNKTRFFEIFDEDYCLFMIKNKILKLNDIDYLIDKLTKTNQVELIANLLDYKNKNFSLNQIEREFEKTLFGEKKVSFSNLKPLWDIEKNENETYEIFGYKGKKTEIEIPFCVSNSFVEKVSLNGKYNNKNINNYLFLKKIIIPNGITEIKDFAFTHLKNVETILIGNSVEIIGESAFKNCQNLSNLVLPKNLKSLKNNAFSNCKNLTNIKIPSDVKIIEKFTFSNCTNLLNVNMENVELIGEQAFSFCLSLRKIILSNNLKQISKYAFYNCINLKDIVLSKNIKQIKKGAFDNCFNLKNIYYLGTEKDWKKINIESKNKCFELANIYYFN